MIEMTTTEFEKREDLEVVYGLLEDYIGRKLRIKQLSGYGSRLLIFTITGRLQSLTVHEYHDSDESEGDSSSFEELCLRIDGQSEDTELDDFENGQLQIEAFQESSGQWVLIYRSKRWKKMLKNGYLE